MKNSVPTIFYGVKILFICFAVIPASLMVSGQEIRPGVAPVLKESVNVPNAADDFLIGPVTGSVKTKAVYLGKPEYPIEARRAGAEGKVRVRISIDEEGNVDEAEAMSGDPALRAVGEAAARRSKFRIARDTAGAAVRTEGVLQYSFEIQKAGWIKIAHGLSLLDSLSVTSFSIPTARKAFGDDWAAELQMLASLDEIRRNTSETKLHIGPPAVRALPDRASGVATASATMQRQLPIPPKPSGGQESIAQNLIVALRERLKADELASWQFDVGLNLNAAMHLYGNRVDRMASAAIIRGLVAKAPQRATTEVRSALRTLEAAFASDPNTIESSGQIRRSFLAVLGIK